MNIDFSGINQQLLSSAETYVRSWLPGGKLNGCEYTAYNPNRQDKHLGSFKINVHNGRWMDGATGDSGGDLVSLYAFINGISQGNAAKQLSGNNGATTTTRPGTVAVAIGLMLCLPVPRNAPLPPSRLKIGERLLAPTHKYRYTNAEGETLRYIYRFDAVPNGVTKKEFRPLTCWRDDSGRLMWKYKDIPDNRPLYGLEALAKRPEAHVLVVSGEKCADIATSNLDDYVVITWSGGDKGVKKSNFAPLTGRKIIWWPDNDESCKRAMKQLADGIGGRMLSIPQGDYPKGWDCADAVDDGLDLRELIVKFSVPILADGEFPPLSLAAPNYIFPHVTNKGKKFGTIENIAALMRYYGLNVWYNEVTKRLGCSIAGKESTEGDKMNQFRTLVKSTCVLNEIASKDIDDMIAYIASRQRKNPVLEWIKSKEWDRISRIPALINSVECIEEMDNELKNTLMLKWMVSLYAAAARVDGDDFQLRGVIVFQGAQSMGKTNFLRSLCGRKYGGDDSWFGVGTTFNAERIDDIVRANRFWILEFAELENTTRFSMAALKAYITNPVNTVRFKYAREETIIWSRTGYAGTVNQMAFLPDQTGNSRFWCLPVLRFNDISHIDMQQVWAEVRGYYEATMADGEKHIWWLTADEERALDWSNRRHESPSSASDLLGARLDWDAPERFWRQATCAQLLIDCGIREDSTKSLLTSAGIYLHRMGLTAHHNGRARIYFAPPKKTDDTSGFSQESVTVVKRQPEPEQVSVF